ncbi:hypothetical protein HY949_03795 [Candidatus Gottesmanbacteria bacterium]|nr:hypothetical protein [Candidatus Gottesmanbacteria bacterium]
MLELTKQIIGSQKNHITYSKIPWDCQHLGNTTVEINEYIYTTKQDAKRLISILIKKLHLTGGDLLFLKTSPLSVFHIRDLTSLGFYVMEEAVEISFHLTNWNPNAFPQHTIKEFRLVPAKNEHLPSIKKIAGSAFTYDRYHLDPHIPANGASNRYIGWVESSMNGSDEVFAFLNSANVVSGFFIIAKSPECINLRLAAIDPSLVGLGLGKLLYFLMITLLKNRGDMNIKTQISLNNTPVLNVYTYLVHPKVTRVEMVLHYTL